MRIAMTDVRDHRAGSRIQVTPAVYIPQVDAFATRDEYLPYWVELWPSGLALARALHGRALRGARVVELGCGLALPSMAAAIAGGRVLATDGAAEAVALATENARI